MRYYMGAGKTKSTDGQDLKTHGPEAAPRLLKWRIHEISYTKNFLPEDLMKDNF